MSSSQLKKNSRRKNRVLLMLYRSWGGGGTRLVLVRALRSVYDKYDLVFINNTVHQCNNTEHQSNNIIPQVAC